MSVAPEVCSHPRQRMGPIRGWISLVSPDADPISPFADLMRPLRLIMRHPDKTISIPLGILLVHTRHETF